MTDRPVTEGPLTEGGVGTRGQVLRALHHGPAPLVLPNVWDAASARACVAAGSAALATASAAVAAVLGHPDGEQAPTADLLASVARVAAAVDVPVSADVEAGLGLAPAELVDRLLAAGVAGLNIEDSDPRTRALRDPVDAARTVAALRAAAGDRLVINARVDVFLRGDGDPAAALERARRYVDAGADCVYPIRAPLAALAELVEALDGVPVNGLAAPEGASVAALVQVGVRRITFGPGLLTLAMDALTARVSTLTARP
jgi:2-methylisocitrate lyase-like PEP mutase family enzyme